jgi:U3 small nucleolar ribonucleoprotein component
MNWFKGFFSGFAKGMAREMIKAALAEAITVAHQEIDKAGNTSAEEKQWMKNGVALLVERLDALVGSKFAQ